MNKIILSFLIFLTFSFSLKGQQEILHKTHAQRLTYLATRFYDNPINQDSIRFFTKVNVLKRIALYKKDRELFLETIYLRLNFLSGRKYKNYIQEIKELIKISDNEKLIYLQARTRQALGFHYFYEHNNYGEALFWFLNSYEYISKLSESDFPEKQEALVNIANICYKMDYPNKALKFLEEAEKYNYKYVTNLKLNILNTKALIYSRLGDYSKTELIFKKLIDVATTKRVEIWKLIATTNLAEFYFKYGFIDKAEETISIECNVDRTENSFEFFKRELLLTECFLAQRKVNTFKNQMKSLIHGNIRTDNINFKQRLYRLHFKYNEMNGNSKLAFLYADSMWMNQTKINVERQENNIKLAVEKDNYIQLLEKEKDIKENKRKSQRQIGLIAVIGILIIIIGFLLFQKKYKKQEQTIQSQDNQISEKEKELNKANAYLENFVEESKRKDKIITDIVQRASNAENHLSTRSIFTDVDWIEFKKEFTTIYPLFFQQLKTIDSKITPALERIAALIILGLESSEMAALLGISTDSVTRSKRRLKEKLPLDQTDLKTFLNGLIQYSQTSNSYPASEKSN